MTIWLDVLTPKQAKLFGHIYLSLRENGYKVILTARNYEYTLSVLRSIGVEYKAVGQYVEGLKEKVVEEAKRMLSLLEILENFDVLIAFPNPVASRIAFGLGKPYIAFTDSPHSKAPSRLSLPLSTAVIFSSCIPREEIEKYIYREGTIIRQFHGVDEVEWLKEFNPDPHYISKWGLEPYEYVVIRPPETKASYYTMQGHNIVALLEKIIAESIAKGYKVFYIPRYKDDPLMHKHEGNPNVIIPSNTEDVDASKISYYAKLVITGGGTMAREAALLGTPGLCLFPTRLYVNECVSEWGFPLFHVPEVQKAYETFRHLIDTPANQLEQYKVLAKERIRLLETPSQALKNVLKEIEKGI
ncbi:MAG: DUF354 domain-containing protein [Ignisphaera sp.]